VVGAQDLAWDEDRDELPGLLRRDEPRAGHAPRPGAAELASMVALAFLRARDLDRADRVEARPTAELQGREQLDRLEGQPGHGSPKNFGGEKRRGGGRGATPLSG